MDGRNWRDNVDPNARFNVISKVVEALQRAQPSAAGHELQSAATKFEESVFQRAESWESYLNKIAAKLHSIDQKGRQAPAGVPPTGGGGNGAMAPVSQIPAQPMWGQQMDQGMGMGNAPQNIPLRLQQPQTVPVGTMIPTPGMPNRTQPGLSQPQQRSQPQPQYLAQAVGGPAMNRTAMQGGMAQPNQMMMQQAFEGQPAHMTQHSQMMHQRQQQALLVRQAAQQKELQAKQAAQKKQLLQQQLMQKQAQQHQQQMASGNQLVQAQLLQRALQQTEQKPPAQPQWQPTQPQGMAAPGLGVADSTETVWQKVQQMKSTYLNELQQCQANVISRLKAIEGQPTSQEQLEKMRKAQGVIQQLLSFIQVDRSKLDQMWKGSAIKLEAIENRLRMVIASFKSKSGGTPSQPSASSNEQAKQQAMQQEAQQLKAQQAQLLQQQLRQKQEEQQRLQLLQQQQQQEARRREEQLQAQKARQQQPQQAKQAVPRPALPIQQQQRQQALNHYSKLTPQQQALLLKRKEAMLAAKVHTTAAALATPSPPLGRVPTPPVVTTPVMTPPAFATPSPNVASASTPPQEDDLESAKVPIPQQEFQAPTPPIQMTHSKSVSSFGGSPQVSQSSAGVKVAQVKEEKPVVIELDKPEEEEKEEPEEDEVAGPHVERLAKKVFDLSAPSPEVLKEAVDELPYLLGYADSAATGTTAVPLRASLGENLAATVHSRLAGGSKGRKRKGVSFGVAVIEADGSVTGLGCQPPQVFSPLGKRMRIASPTWRQKLEAELGTVNDSLVETSVEMDEEETEKLADGAVLRCTYTGAAAVGIPPLQIRVPKSYPEVAPEVVPCRCINSTIPVAQRAVFTFEKALLRLHAPLAILPIVRAWDESARSALAEAAARSGGGSFSTKVACWQECGS